MLTHRNLFFENLGWDARWESEFAPWAKQGATPARVAVRHKGQYAVLTEEGEAVARIKKILMHQAESEAELPVVGDWVALSKHEHDNEWRIQAVLARRTCLMRKRKGTVSEHQVLAANVDVVFVVMGLDDDFNVRRIERFLVITRESGAQPVILLNKADLFADEPELLETSVAEVAEVAGDAPIHAISAEHSLGLGVLRKYIAPGRTVVFAGSSGTGKSTLVNALAQDELQATGGLNESTGRGRHTTTQREMILLEPGSFCGGGIVIDSPGVREVQLAASEDDALDEAFREVEELAARCRFSDCTHEEEPGCAIREAIESGELEPSRFDSYLRLQDERAEADRRRAAIMDREGRKRGRPHRKSRREGKKGRHFKSD
ncbi:MAG: ribosome small subunit-dependent GTPase A [Sumerlaeia bacterium]